MNAEPEARNWIASEKSKKAVRVIIHRAEGNSPRQTWRRDLLEIEGPTDESSADSYTEQSANGPLLGRFSIKVT